MRIAVLILALLGILGPGFLGMVGQTQLQNDKKRIEELRKEIEEYGDVGGLVNVQKFKEGYQQYQRGLQAFWFLLAAVPLGIAGGLLAFFGRGISAGVLLLTVALAPILMVPEQAKLGFLIFSSVLCLAGVLAFFVRPPKPKTASPRPGFEGKDVADRPPVSRKRSRRIEEDEDDEDDEDDEEYVPRSRRGQQADEDAPPRRKPPVSKTNRKK